MACKKIFLDSSIGELSGIGPKKALGMNQAGISTVGDLLRFYPQKYQDRRQPTTIAQLVEGSPALLRAKLESIKSHFARRGLAIISARFSDETGEVQARWFNKTYLCRQLKEGQHYWLFGAIATGKTPVLANPEIEADEIEQKVSKADSSLLTPVYSSNARLSEAKISPLGLRKLIEKTIQLIDWQKSFPDFILDSSFKVISKSLREIHFPKDLQMADKAKHTLAFFDQVLFQIGVLKRREALTGFLTLPDSRQTRMYEPQQQLPFKLTNAQKRSLSQIINDLQDDEDQPPMNRLLQGDVGSGKTLVAFLSMIEYIERNKHQVQATFMAPTEILARQHLASFRLIFPHLADQAIILTGSQKKAEQNAVKSKISKGIALYIFGTHALFQQSVEFKHLGFCIIDEQQRFGVNHRRTLFRKGRSPHQLLLSATPIPRTLSLTIFGDMDTSIIDELPPGRKPVTTLLFDQIGAAMTHISDALAQRQKVYIVCPLIEVSDKKDWKSVEETADTISELLPETSIACLTGQQSWEEKQQTMQHFKEGRLQIIIATTVIEVGVDDPEATLMVIENADCFGLSQLHQLRGRVGRSSHQSTCILISHLQDSNERLQILASTSDGFELSMEDLRLRGPGDIVGTRQSGLSHPCFSHRIPQKLVENARNRAFEILTREDEQIKDWFLLQMQKSFGDSYKTFMEGG